MIGGFCILMAPPACPDVRLLLKAPTGERLEQSIHLQFPASNNEAEYEVILSGIGLAITLKASKVKIDSDY